MLGARPHLAFITCGADPISPPRRNLRRAHSARSCAACLEVAWNDLRDLEDRRSCLGQHSPDRGSDAGSLVRHPRAHGRSRGPGCGMCRDLVLGLSKGHHAPHGQRHEGGNRTPSPVGGLGLRAGRRSRPIRWRRRRGEDFPPKRVRRAASQTVGGTTRGRSTARRTATPGTVRSSPAATLNTRAVCSAPVGDAGRHGGALGFFGGREEHDRELSALGVEGDLQLLIKAFGGRGAAVCLDVADRAS